MTDAAIALALVVALIALGIWVAAFIWNFFHL